SSVSLRPVIRSSSCTALYTPAVTSLYGASAVVTAEERATKRYSSPTTSRMAARVYSDPMSTARIAPTVATVGAPSAAGSSTAASCAPSVVSSSLSVIVWVLEVRSQISEIRYQKLDTETPLPRGTVRTNTQSSIYHLHLISDF